MGGEINLAGWFTARARATPERAAVSFDGATRTFGELDVRIRRLAAALIDGGIARGDRVGFLALNQPQILEGLFAAAAAGAIFVPLNFRCTGAELVYMIEDAGIRTLFADAANRATIDGVRDELTTVERYIATDAPAAGWEAWDDVLAGVDPVDELRLAPDEECAVIMYTSGTTGRPKGAMLSHRGLWFNNINILSIIDVQRDDVSLIVAPLFHIGALNVLTLATWIKGGRLIIHRSFDPAATLRTIEAERVVTMFGVPSMFQFMAGEPGFAGTDLSSLGTCVCGGSPLPESMIRAYLDRGVNFAQGYGLTEASPMVAFLTPEYALEKLGSTGRPPIFCEVEIMDTEGRATTEPGVPGEICARGPNVTLGYHDNPRATAEAIDADGWLHTGDGGYRDADGFIYVTDRIKDMIISGGENIYPAEVEAVLFEHPSITEAAVIGVADERWGEAVCAVIVTDDASLDLEAIRGFAADRLARYKLPKRLEILDALPRNPAGKVVKVDLRARFQ